MTREQSIELILLRLQGMNTGATFDEQYIEAAMDLAWEDLIFKVSGNVTNDEAFYAKLFTPVTVTLGSDEFYYSEFSGLSGQLIHLDRIGSGVVSINQVNSQEFDFVPASDKVFSLLPTQDVWEISRKIYYKVGYDRIVFDQKMTSDIATVGVSIRMLCSYSSFDYDEHIPIPAGQIDMFFDSVVARIIGTPIADASNKNN